MNKAVMLKLAGSALVLGTTLVGGGMAAQGVAADSVDGSGSSSASRAAKALQKKDAATAIVQAENAVAASPRNAAYRLLLGQAYLAGGRFVSAESALLDTLALDPANSRAALSLVLAQIALGRPDIARDTLDKTGGSIPVADRGLALALAGDIHTAIDTLEPAARDEGANAKTRQNLALTYALAGDWAKARTIAAQDVPADQLNRRMLTWAAFAQPRNSWDQVASLLGVKATLDSGQPARLALAPEAIPAQPEQALAAAEPAPEAAPAPAPVEVAAADVPAPVETVSADPVQTPVLASIIFAPRQEVVQSIPASLIPADLRPVRKAVTQTAAAPAPRAVAGGRFVVQLGSFSTAANAEAAWKKAVRSNRALASFIPNGESFSGKGRTFHRVAAGGFASRRVAEQMCASVKANGGVCFVRAESGAPQSAWAQRLAGVRLASR